MQAPTTKPDKRRHLRLRRPAGAWLRHGPGRSGRFAGFGTAWPGETRSSCSAVAAAWALRTAWKSCCGYHKRRNCYFNFNTQHLCRDLILNIGNFYGKGVNSGLRGGARDYSRRIERQARGQCPLRNAPCVRRSSSRSRKNTAIGNSNRAAWKTCSKNRKQSSINF